VLPQNLRSSRSDCAKDLAALRNEMNERLMAFGDSLLAAPGRHPSPMH
jgi:hypothetical protein